MASSSSELTVHAAKRQRARQWQKHCVASSAPCLKLRVTPSTTEIFFGGMETFSEDRALCRGGTSVKARRKTVRIRFWEAEAVAVNLVVLLELV